jgi:hypothetical protein
MRKAWNYYQDVGDMGPVGYLDGWFVNWSLSGRGTMVFDLERDDSCDYLADIEPTRLFILDWLRCEEASRYSHALHVLRRAYLQERDERHVFA